MAKKPTAGFVPGDFAAPDTPDYVIAELRYDSRVVISAKKRFAAPAAAETKAADLNSLLADFKVKRLAPHFDMPEKKLAMRAQPPGARAKVSADFAQHRFSRRRGV